MEVRYNQETDAMGLKNGLKKGKDDKESQGNLSKSFLKEQQDSFSPSGTVDNCEKNRGSTGDPDYCRRILVRGRAPGLSFSFWKLQCRISEIRAVNLRKHSLKCCWITNILDQEYETASLRIKWKNELTVLVVLVLRD